LGLTEFLTLLSGYCAEFTAELEDFEAQAVELGFGGGEEALGSLVLAVVGFGPVGHFELEEGV
jgi:hypothetical protein